MMGRATLLGCLLLATAFIPARTMAETLIADMSSNLVAITSSFTGASILMFGAIDQRENKNGDKPNIVVVVRGPTDTVKVRRKERTAGIWINRASADFENVPGFYVVASTGPLKEIATETTLGRLQIGVDYLNLEPDSNSYMTEEEEDGFRKALIRSRTRDNLYRMQETEIEFLGDTLFRVNVHLPANVPIGNYTTEAYLFRDGEDISVYTSPLYVSKVGMERRVFNFANDYSLLYGIAAVLVAIGAGWAAAAIFRQT